MADQSSTPDVSSSVSSDAAPSSASITGGLDKLLQMVLAHDTIVSSSILLGGGLYLTGLTRITSPAFWIAAAPVLYLLWVFLFLVCSAMSTGLMLAFAPKPRHFIVKEPGNKARLPLLGAGACYQRWFYLQSLPLIGAHMWGIRSLRWLAMRAYSGNPQCLDAGLLADFPVDPDLTEVGDQTIIGGGAILTAHAVGTHEDCMFTYASAPIQIGSSVTIGAGSRVEMGCQMGDGSILEPGSVLSAFSIVGPQEVWSGVPAQFVRMRTHAGANRRTSALDVTTSMSPAARDQARTLVNEALNDIRESDSWDSLDQMAIAAALFTRTGVAVPADEIFQLYTFDDVAARLTDIVDASKSSESAGTTDNQLPANPELLPLLNRQAVSTQLATLLTADGPGSKAMTVVIAASFTADLMTSTLRAWSRAFGVSADVQSAGFNQIQSALLNPQSTLAGNRGGVNVILQAADDLPEGREQEYVTNVLDAVDAFLKYSAGRSRLCVASLPPPVSDIPADRRTAIESARRIWNTRLEQTSGIDVIPLARLIESVGIHSSWDHRMHASASCPYSMQVLSECGVEIARIVRRQTRPRAKVLAVDCDNTIWGGVVGEVGIDGIELGSDSTGAHFRNLQQWIISQQEAGVLIVIVSRNEEHDVWNVFDNHPDMILQRDHIVAHRINWQPKSENLRSLAEELNLGIDSFVFVDDDPAVRLEVETSLPTVTVVPLTKPSEYTAQLRRLWAFDVSDVTEEDRQRSAMVLAEQKRTRAAEASGSFDDYLAGLELKVEVREAADGDLPRVAQLTQKTNQFNLSVNRRTTEELRDLPNSRILAVSVTDRFGDYGTTGVAILSDHDSELWLDTLLLSCRVLGRRVEDAFLAAVHSIARDLGAVRLVTSVVETPRNQPARQFLKESGASHVGDQEWEWDLSKSAVCPTSVDLTVELATDTAH